jgi:hypothetical protein
MLLNDRDIDENTATCPPTTRSMGPLVYPARISLQQRLFPKTHIQRSEQSENRHLERPKSSIQITALTTESPFPSISIAN